VPARLIALEAVFGVVAFWVPRAAVWALVLSMPSTTRTQPRPTLTAATCLLALLACYF